MLVNERVFLYCYILLYTRRAAIFLKVSTIVRNPGLSDFQSGRQKDDCLLKETIDQLENGVRWYGHVLRRDDDSVLRVALNLEVTGKRKRGRPKKTWKKQVEEETEKIGLKKEDASGHLLRFPQLHGILV